MALLYRRFSNVYFKESNLSMTGIIILKACDICEGEKEEKHMLFANLVIQPLGIRFFP